MKAETIAKYFLNKDLDNSLFTDELISKNGSDFYNGNARLNKYLHIAQNAYIAQNGKLLFDDDLYAFANGAIVKSVMEEYQRIKTTKSDVKEVIPEKTKIFLDKIYIMLKNASLDELIDISHEDDEWKNKRASYKTYDEQKMDSLKNIDIYKKQYADALKIMDTIC